MCVNSSSSSFSSIGTKAHCGLWLVEKCHSIFSYLPSSLSIFSLPALEDLFLLPLSIFSWVFPFFSSLPALEWRSFWASYLPPFSLGDLTSLQDLCECLHKLKELVLHPKTKQRFMTPCVRKQFSMYSPHVLRTSVIIFLSIWTPKTFTVFSYNWKRGDTSPTHCLCLSSNSHSPWDI